MKPWNLRPIEIRNLFNPAFCGLLMHRAIVGFRNKDEKGMPFSLSLLILPLCLQQASREILKAGNKSYLLKVVAEHPELLVDFAGRCTDTLPFTLEGLGVLMQHGALSVNDEGRLLPGSARVVAAVNGSDETKACQRVAAYIGKQFALVGDRGTIYTTLGSFYYLFQKQGLVTNKDQLFYRQNEPQQPQAIKDTLPILLGVSGRDKFTLESQLRIAQRDLRLNTKLLQQAREAIDNSEERAIGLVSEARAVEIPLGDDATNVVGLLRKALEWQPTPVSEDDGARISAIERDLLDLRDQRREVQRRIEGAQQFSRRSEGFEVEASEQRDRLKSIRAFWDN